MLKPNQLVVSHAKYASLLVRKMTYRAVWRLEILFGWVQFHQLDKDSSMTQQPLSVINPPIVMDSVEHGEAL